MKRFSVIASMLMLVLFLAACGSDDGDSETLVMGFVPSQDSENIASTVEPLEEKLAEELGMEVKGEVMTSYNALVEAMGDRKSTRLNSSHVAISYAVFCLKKKK